MKILAATNRGSFKFLLKGQRSVPSTHLFSKGAERRHSDVIGEGVEGERERFRSFTTFSVFMRLKAKGKGILMRLVFYLSPSFSGTVVGTCTGNPARATEFYLKCIWHPRLVLHLHEAYPPKCARILHVHAYISPLLSSWRTGRGHDNLLWPVFWKTKVWLALPKIEVHLHNIILTLKLLAYSLLGNKNVDVIIYLYNL